MGAKGVERTCFSIISFSGDKMKKFLFPIVLLAACNTPCSTESVITEGLANGIASGLQCTNKAQIQSDIVAILNKANICSTAIEGPIASAVCPIVAQGAVSLLGSQIPSNWQCNPTLASQGLVAVLTTACNALPF